ncbi:GFA family protein [Vibrio zhugei]|uniref:GFA family protein n=1 Tax=Vibrio zhugei TaxID=2479546 RepID=A0ABV7CBE7_9VIBR|nr:GFA family protein [Vibrio zhugei]
MSHQYLGSCLCGAVKYQISGDFQSFFLCHCTRCQKGTGSAHAANLFAKGGVLTWLQNKDDVKTYQHPHSQHVKSFCQQCGSALPTLIESIDSVLVPAGSLDSPVPIRPTAQIFVESSVGWLETLDDVPSYATLPVDDKK